MGYTHTFDNIQYEISDSIYLLLAEDMTIENTNYTLACSKFSLYIELFDFTLYTESFSIQHLDDVFVPLILNKDYTEIIRILLQHSSNGFYNISQKCHNSHDNTDFILNIDFTIYHILVMAKMNILLALTLSCVFSPNEMFNLVCYRNLLFVDVDIHFRSGCYPIYEYLSRYDPSNLADQFILSHLITLYDDNNKTLPEPSKLLFPNFFCDIIDLTLNFKIIRELFQRLFYPLHSTTSEIFQHIDTHPILPTDEKLIVKNIVLSHLMLSFQFLEL
jgi:hypothetical protein